MRRGLTLIEVVLATALLAALAVVVMPIVAGARAHLASAKPSADLFMPASTADLALTDPTRLGLASDWTDHVLEGSVTIHTESGTYRVRCVMLAEDHAWIVFESAHGSAMRWIKVEPEDDA